MRLRCFKHVKLTVFFSPHYPLALPISTHYIITYHQSQCVSRSRGRSSPDEVVCCFLFLFIYSIYNTRYTYYIFYMYNTHIYHLLKTYTSDAHTSRRPEPQIHISCCMYVYSNNVYIFYYSM